MKKRFFCIVLVLILLFSSAGCTQQTKASEHLEEVAYSASVNVATFLVILVPIIVSVVALIKGLFRRKQK